MIVQLNLLDNFSVVLVELCSFVQQYFYLLLNFHVVLDEKLELPMAVTINNIIILN